MGKFIKITLLLVIFLAGCTHSSNEKVEDFTPEDTYFIRRSNNGVYLYVDKLNSTDLKVYVY